MAFLIYRHGEFQDVAGFIKIGVPLDALHAAGKMLTDGLKQMMPGLAFNTKLVKS